MSFQIKTKYIENAAVTGVKIAATAVDEAKLAASVAGDGIAGGAGTPLSADLTTAGGLKIVAGQIAVEAADIAGSGLEDDGSDNLRIAAAAAGDGISGGGGSALALDLAVGGGLKIVAGQAAVEPADFAGTGLEDDGSDNLRIAAAAAGDGLQGGGGAALAVNATVVRANGSVAFTAPQTGVTPTTPAHLATKGYVDSISESLDIKGSVRIASAASVANLSSVTVANFDGAAQGITLVVGDRVLVKDGASANGIEAVSAKRNGIYVVGTVAGGLAPLTRASDADASAEVTAGMFCFVSEGTNADIGFVLTTNDVITLDTTLLSFTAFSGAGQIEAGAGLTKTANTINVGDANKGVQANADDLQVDGSEIAGNGIAQNGTNTWKVDVKPDAVGGANLAKSVNVSANGVAIKVDGTTIEEGVAGQLRVKADGIGPAQLDETAAYNFTAGSVDVATQAPGNNATKAASTAFVQAAIAAFSTETVKTESHLITTGENTAGKFTLAAAPVNAQSVSAWVEGGGMGVNSANNPAGVPTVPDFEVSGSDFKFNASGAPSQTLTNILSTGDIVHLRYEI